MHKLTKLWYVQDSDWIRQVVSIIKIFFNHKWKILLTICKCFNVCNSKTSSLNIVSGLQFLIVTLIIDTSWEEMELKRQQYVVFTVTKTPRVYFVLDDSQENPPPTVGRGLVQNVEMVQISETLGDLVSYNSGKGQTAINFSSVINFENSLYLCKLNVMLLIRHYQIQVTD